MASIFAILLAVLIGAHSARAGCLIVHHRASGQDVKLEAYGEDSIRVRAIPSDAAHAFRDDLVSALVDLPATSGSGTCAETTIAAADESSAATAATATPPSLTHGNLKASVSASSGLLSFTRVSDGKALLTEQSVRAFAPAKLTPAAAFAQSNFLSLELNFAPVKGERIYGLGQHAKLAWDPSGAAKGQLDMKGVKGLLLAPHDGEILIPIAHSSVGYAMLWNLPCLGSVEYNSTVSHWHGDAVLQLDLWVTTTAAAPAAEAALSPWAQLQSNYADATGHAPVWPAWTTGFWQCKLRYANQTQLMNVAREYVRRDIPLSLIIIDFFNWNDPAKPKATQNTLGDETLPATCWPNPKEMVDELHAIGVELMVSPYSHSVSKTSVNWEAAHSGGLLAIDGDGAANLSTPAKSYAGGYAYDLFNPAARDFAWAKMNEGYVRQYGLHHWWLDCDEPCGGTNNGSYGQNFIYNNGTWPSAFVGAAYPQMLDRMIYDGMGAPGKEYEKDNVMLGRSAWAGSQRYGGSVWSGDTQSTWDDFNQQFRAGLNMVMSGIPYFTTDIGGFASGDTTDPSFRELVVRWFQWGAFNPLFRLHGDRGGKSPHWPANDPGGVCGITASNEVWSFGNESYTAILAVMRMREQLRPYVTEQYESASKSGLPIMRPLFFDFHDDETSQHVDDEMMFGPLYLVAPVLTHQATSRDVYLPPLSTSSGDVWVNVFTGVETDTSQGGVNITEVTPNSGAGFATFPLYRRQARGADYRVVARVSTDAL